MKVFTVSESDDNDGCTPYSEAVFSDMDSAIKFANKIWSERHEMCLPATYTAYVFVYDLDNVDSGYMVYSVDNFTGWYNEYNGLPMQSIPVRK